MRRAERRRAERQGKTPRPLAEIDYLLMVDDEARQGALRFAGSEAGPFLAEHGPAKIPPLIELPRLLSAAEHVLAGTDADEDLRLLLAPGSSLGGAPPRPPFATATVSWPSPSFRARETRSMRYCGRPWL
jgi:serine/threonine-protein kinase HipA